MRKTMQRLAIYCSVVALLLTVPITQAQATVMTYEGWIG